MRVVRRTSPVMVEPLEDRRLWSAAAIVAAAGPTPARPPPVVVSRQHVPQPAGRVHAFDDSGDSGDGGGDGGGGSGGDDGGGFDDGGSGGGYDPGGSDTAGSTTTGGGTADSGGSDNGGGFGDPAGGSGGSYDPGTADGGSSTPGSTGDGGTGGTDNGGTTGGGGSDPIGDDGGDPALLYPSGAYVDDTLYDVGVVGVGVVGLPVYATGANFGGTVNVRLPAGVVPGARGVATVRVFNVGQGTAGRFDLAIGVTPDGSAAAAVRVGEANVGVHLGHDRVATFKVPFQLPATLVPGSYRVLALIDAGNAFDETDEADNVAVGPAVTVTAASPDVAVTGVRAARVVRAGGHPRVVVRLANVGTGVSGVTVTITAEPADASAVADTVTHSVQVIVTRPRSVAVPIQLPTSMAGRYRFVVTISPADPADVDVADKSAAVAVTVRPAAVPRRR